MSNPYYKDDLVTLFHGDCLEVTEWLAADVLVTDPPYGVDWKGTHNYVKGASNAPKWSDGIANDENSIARDIALSRWAEKPAIVFGSWKVARPEKTNHRLIWHKAGMPPGPLNAAFMSQDEEIYILGSGYVKTSPPMRSVLRTDEHRSTASQLVGHPTPKPIGLMELLIERCQPEWVIADPFAGGGATLIAARNLGRQVIGVELEERYCELIAKRLSQQVFDFTELEEAHV